MEGRRVASTQEREAMAAALEAPTDYRVLRRLMRRNRFNDPTGADIRRGPYIDLETTDLDHTRDEIIEIAMVPFTYAIDGRIFDIGEPFQAFRQPSNPIPTEMKALTGINDTMVAGKTINPCDVAAFAAPAALLVAHHATFDRKFSERCSDVFKTKAWACSMSQVDRQAAGFEGTTLAYLAAGAGVDEKMHQAKITFLTKEIYQREISPLTRTITAYDRFSDRA